MDYGPNSSRSTTAIFVDRQVVAGDAALIQPIKRTGVLYSTPSLCTTTQLPESVRRNVVRAPFSSLV